MKQTIDKNCFLQLMHYIYLTESFLMVHTMFHIVDFNFVHTEFSELYLGFYTQDSAQLLLSLLVCFLSGSRLVLSYKILHLIPSLAVFSWILSFALLYLQGNQHPKVTKINCPTLI